MCLALAEGFVRPSNEKKYFSRLLTFAIIAQIPFSFLWVGNLHHNTLAIMLLHLHAHLPWWRSCREWKIGTTLKKDIIASSIVLLVLSMNRLAYIGHTLFTVDLYEQENKDRQAICYASATAVFRVPSSPMCKPRSVWYGQVWQIGTLLVIDYL